MKYGTTHEVSEADGLAGRATLARYRRFMALKLTSDQLHKQLDYLGLTPGHNWRGAWSGMQMKQTPGCSKDDMAVAYATGSAFIPGALKVLEEKFGTRWKVSEHQPEEGLW